VAGGIAGNAVASGINNPITAKIVSGAVSGATSAMLSNVLSGRNLGDNVLQNAAMGAAMAGLGALAESHPISRAGAVLAQGGGATGESQAEIDARKDQAAWDPARRESWFAGDPNGGNPVSYADGTTVHLADKLKLGIGGRLVEAAGLNGFVGWTIDDQGNVAFTLELGVSAGVGGSLNFGDISTGSIEYGFEPYTRLSGQIGPFSVRRDVLNDSWTAYHSFRPGPPTLGLGVGADTGLRLRLHDPVVTIVTGGVATMGSAYRAAEVSATPGPGSYIQTQASALNAFRMLFGN
jgi:hypothetical protein